MKQSTITIVETGGHNDFGSDEIPIIEPGQDGERCEVCGEIIPAGSLTNRRIGSRREDLISVLACGECRIEMEKIARSESGCPNCGDPMDHWPPDHYLRFTGHRNFGRTPQLEICEECFEGYEEL